MNTITTKDVVLRFFILIFLGFYSYQGFSFPENFRKGYRTCRGCHVSPAGGGTLTEYGQSTSASVMSMWGDDEHGQTFYGAAKLPEEINIGGDVRTLLYRTENPTSVNQRSFLMQADLEIAVHPSDQMSFVASTGYYGIPVFDPITREQQLEYKSEARRYYLSLTPHIQWSTRVGKFYPAYGLMIPDHTQNIRRSLGFGQNKESFNIEQMYFAEDFELALTGSVDNEDKNKRIVYARAVKYWSKKLRTGVSLKWDDYVTAGIHGMAAISKSYYTLFELDFQQRKATDETQKPNIYGYAEIGFVPVQGLHFKTRASSDLSTEQETYRYSLMSLFYPFPHFEFSGEIVNIQAQQGEEKLDDTQAIVLMSHYYF